MLSRSPSHRKTTWTNPRNLKTVCVPLGGATFPIGGGNGSLVVSTHAPLGGATLVPKPLQHKGAGKPSSRVKDREHKKMCRQIQEKPYLLERQIFTTIANRQDFLWAPQGREQHRQILLANDNLPSPLRADAEKHGDFENTTGKNGKNRVCKTSREVAILKISRLDCSVFHLRYKIVFGQNREAPASAPLG